jgi:ATP-dependent RNA helicase SUPV3L1/SUV3
MYQSIGYPVFGPRAIRADVAERVHKELASVDVKTLSRSHLASWMGCPASQVPTILAAMTTEVVS